VISFLPHTRPDFVLLNPIQNWRSITRSKLNGMVSMLKIIKKEGPTRKESDINQFIKLKKSGLEAFLRMLKPDFPF
jgi:hypothetical protein